MAKETAQCIQIPGFEPPTLQPSGRKPIKSSKVQGPNHFAHASLHLAIHAHKQQQ